MSNVHCAPIYLAQVPAWLSSLFIICRYCENLWAHLEESETNKMIMKRIGKIIIISHALRYSYM